MAGPWMRRPAYVRARTGEGETRPGGCVMLWRLGRRTTDERLSRDCPTRPRPVHTRHAHACPCTHAHDGLPSCEWPSTRSVCRSPAQEPADTPTTCCARLDVWMA